MHPRTDPAGSLKLRHSTQRVSYNSTKWPRGWKSVGLCASPLRTRLGAPTGCCSGNLTSLTHSHRAPHYPSIHLEVISEAKAEPDHWRSLGLTRLGQLNVSPQQWSELLCRLTGCLRLPRAWTTQGGAGLDHCRGHPLLQVDWALRVLVPFQSMLSSRVTYFDSQAPILPVVTRLSRETVTE